MWEVMIRMHEFIDDEAGYLHWVQTNPLGFVINTPKHPSYFPDMLHRASCKSISTSKRTNYTTTDFKKICSVDRQELLNWAVSQSTDFRKCQHCHP